MQRILCFLTLFSLAVIHVAWALDAKPAGSRLTLDEAVRIGLVNHPLIERSRQIEAEVVRCLGHFGHLASCSEPWVAH